MNDTFASIPLTAVFLTHFEGLDLYAIEHTPSGTFISYLARKSRTGKRTTIRPDFVTGEWSSIPKTWGRLADDLYSEYVDSRVRGGMAS
jgi:hypothetical protein